jgi:hypothetical protein
MVLLSETSLQIKHARWLHNMLCDTDVSEDYFQTDPFPT